ncbi:MAG: AAA family ATPase [Candidatus Sericytochromatia bacterium]|nr:AAA family ATPase [Candidatus Sericytochromatia bacterium]
MPALIANRYEVLAPLGSGAMGVVSHVRDAVTGQEAALKVIAPRHRANEKSALQIKQEFRLMSQLRHPHCCQVFDYGVTPEGEPYFTMEYVPGDSLSALVPLPRERFVAVMTELLAALGYIHQAGLVHLDVKSDNVRIRPDGSVKLMDYGLMDHARKSGGFVNGTLSYIAPEVIRRGSIDQRTDLYSLGVLAYEMLTGRLPFESEVARELLQAHIEHTPPLPSTWRPDIDPQHEQIVMKLLAKNPLDRFQSAQQVLLALGAEVAERARGMLLTSPMAGRDLEMRMLDTALAAIAAGRKGGGLMVCGAPGIGKSRLLQEFRFKVQLADLLCVTGANFETSNAPYEPWVTALRQLMGQLEALMQGSLAAHGPILARLLPELGPAAPPLDSPTKERLRLQAAIAETLARISVVHPLVVVLEDWQWADPLSIELLDYVLRNTREHPLLIVLSSRTTPEYEPPNLSVLPVSGLTREGVRRMVTAMLGTQQVASGFIDGVAGLAKGSPFFVERLLEHLVQNGTLTYANGRWDTELELAVDQLPKNLKGLLMWRITCLDETTQGVANAAAVLAHAMTLDMLGAVAQVGDDELFQAVGALAQAHVLVESEGGEYAFAQDLIQELLAANLDVQERQRLHSRACEALEAKAGGSWTDLSAQRDWAARVPLDLVTSIAHHALQGPGGAAAIAWALEAGSRHAALFANAPAEHFLTAGLSLIAEEAEPGRFDQDRLRLLACLGDVRRVMGRNDVAKRAYQEAVPLAESLGERRLLGHLLSWLGRCHQVLGDLDEALTTVRRAMEVASDVGDELGAIRAMILAARIAYFSGDLPLAIEFAEQALARAEAAGFTGQVGESLGMLGYFYVASDPERAALGVAYLQRSETCLSELQDWIALNTTLNFLGSAQNLLSDFRGAQRTFARNRGICFEIGANDELVIADLNLAITDFELGLYADMEGHAAEAKAVAATLNSKYTRGMALCLHAVASAFVGRPDSVVKQLQEALAIARALQHKYMESQVLMYQARALTYLGCFLQAEEASEALLALMTATGDHEPAGRLRLDMAELAARRGDIARARAILDDAAASAGSHGGQGAAVGLPAMKALVALLAGEQALAERTAREALAVAEFSGTRQVEALSRQVLGEVALAGGRADEAKRHYEALLATAKAIGSPVFEAYGLFGLAAAEPAAPQARSRALQARALLEDQAGRLEDPLAGAFFTHAERTAIRRGNPRAGGLLVAVPG